jgi:Neisseria meningitidis TspB protein
MTRLISILALAIALAACDAATDATPSPSVEPSEQPSATAEPTQEPTVEPTPTTEPSPSPSAASDGGFQPAANAEADALFVERDTCENRRDGYQLVYPDDWFTNTEFRDVAPCSWFAPTTYEVDEYPAIPEEIAITIEWVADSVSWAEDPIRTDTGMVGGQNAVRVEFPDEYFYVIQLGPTPEEGPNLIARSAAHMGGDYELNKAVLDRLMWTIEFIGSTQ